MEVDVLGPGCAGVPSQAGRSVRVWRPFWVWGSSTIQGRESWTRLGTGAGSRFQIRAGWESPDKLGWSQSAGDAMRGLWAGNPPEDAPGGIRQQSGIGGSPRRCPGGGAGQGGGRTPPPHPGGQMTGGGGAGPASHRLQMRLPRRPPPPPPAAPRHGRAAPAPGPAAAAAAAARARPGRPR